MAKRKEELKPLHTNNAPKAGDLMRAHDGVIRVILDLGNSVIKVTIVTDTGQEFVWFTISYPHALRTLTEAQFEEEQMRAKYAMVSGNKLTDVFQYSRKVDGEMQVRSFEVGENAERTMDSRRTGGPKYRWDYYPALFLKALLELLPDGYDNIHVLALFPSSDFRHIETIMKTIGGKHAVELANGKKVVYNVRKVSVDDEPNGGLNNYLLADDGVHYRTVNIPEGRGLCVDVGGKISSMTPFNRMGWVGRNDAQPKDIGIQDSMGVFGDLILAKKKFEYLTGHGKDTAVIDTDLFEAHRGRGLPQDEAMRKAFLTGVYETNGYPLVVKNEIEIAKRTVLNGLRDLYTQEFSGGGGFNYIVVTGGGGGLLFHELVSQVFSNFNVHRVYMSHPDDPMNMYLANIMGARKKLIGSLAWASSTQIIQEIKEQKDAN